METKTIVPQEITNPFMRVNTLMVDEQDIPKEFNMMSGNKWVRLFDDMFFKGIRLTNVIPKDGIDKDKALKHIRVIATSWEPSHEHKTACCAYLFSLWFEDIEYEIIKTGN